MKRLLFPLAFLCLLLILVSPVGYGQTNGWSRPLRLGDGWFPDTIADDSGMVHVVWASGVEPIKGTRRTIGYDVVSYVRSSNGQRWSEINDIAAIRQYGEDGRSSEVTRPALLLDQNGLLHMAYRSANLYYSQVNLIQATDASKWYSPQQLGESGYFMELGRDHDGRLFYFYTANVPNQPLCSICFHLFARYSDDNGMTWSNPVDISSLSNIGSAKPQVFITQDNILHVVWESGPGGTLGTVSEPVTVKYSRSTDRGRTWSFPYEFVPGKTARNITINQDNMGRLITVWHGRQEDLLYYQLSTNDGQSWTEPMVIPDVVGGVGIFGTALDHYVTAIDSNGLVHLVFVGRTSFDQRSLDLLHLVWNGSKWSYPDVIASFYGDVPEWPAITIANGNRIHVTWFIRPEAYIWSGGFGSQIWYAQRTLDAPGTAPVPLPTLTPMPTPTSVPVITLPTTEPLSNEAIQSEALSFYGDITTENDEVFLILQSLIPALLFIGLATTIARRLRH